MQTLIISDTTCLVLLDKIGELELLKKLYQEVAITTTIFEEFKKPIPYWINIQNPSNNNYFLSLSEMVDPGEASAIALSVEIENSILILDDLKARKLASELQLKYTGTIGILLLAKNKGLINDFNRVIEKIQETNFRLSNAILERLKSEN
jgi:predicted nucleic acid-binding protein